jgi:enterobactin synthetase component F
MTLHEGNYYPLTTAQRGLYFTQKITPTANLNIAEAVEICGAIKPEIFQLALRQLVAEAEELRLFVIKQDGKPKQAVRPVYEGDFPYIDMSLEANPQSAIETWMRAELARPIDLSKDPLWVSALLKASDDRYFWYQRAHHIGVDGYGGGLIARRVAELYTELAEGRDPAPASFCTVAALTEAESNYRNSSRFQRDREYWHQQLAQLPEAATLSRSHGRHALSSEQRRSAGYLSAETAQALADLGKTVGASLPQVLTSLVAAYYQRVSGVNDLVFLMPVSGRINAMLRHSLAPSVNAVPVRASFHPQMTSAELFVQISKTVRQALRHQLYRFEDLRRDLGRISHEQNIAWLGVNVEPFDYHITFGGATTISHNLSNSSAEDLMVFIYDRGAGAGLRFDLDANPALYDMAELDEHRRRLTRLVDQVLAHPDTPLSQLDIMGDEERHRLLVRWNDTGSSIPDIRLPALVAQWAAATPDAPALMFEDTVVSYRELHERSVRQARQLIASGVKSGDIVAVALPRNEQLLIVLLAIMRTGAAYLPIDLESPLERTALVLDDALPIVLIAESKLHARFANRDVTLLQPEHLDASLITSEEEPDLSTPNATAYVLYTSGSTGRPKGVEVTHRNLANFLHGMQRELDVTARDRFLAVTTIVFDIAGLELYLPLTVGARVVMASSEAAHNPPSLAQLILRSGATHMQATPSLWRVLLASAQTKLNGVHVLVGGEALSAELASRLKVMAPRVTQLYGPTETTVWSTALELGRIGSVPPPIGRPLLNTRLYVLDEYRQLVVTGAVGELYIGGEGVAKGYLHRPELNEERFLADPFREDGGRMYRTGDLVRWIDDGLLEFIGRTDNQVKVNGHRIELGEIENLLLQHEAVAEAAVAAHRDDNGTVSLASYLVESKDRPINIDMLRVFLAGRLPDYMMPDSFMVLDVMPLTPNGKLDRKALPIPKWTSRNTYVEPVTPDEKKLAALWQQILKVERVGLHDDFFDLGGDSLNAAEMAALFPAWFQTELELGTLFEAPTVGALSKVIERRGSSEYIEPLSVMLPLRKVAQRPLFCIHPIIGVSMGFSALLPHIDPMIPVYGLQSRGLRGGGSLPSSIQEVAADYLVQIRHIQPEGPYRLIGRSLGGLLGHCIAEQMQEQGLQVELLAMIDSYLFRSRESARPRTEEEEVRTALNFLGIDLIPENIPGRLEELGEFLLHSDNAHVISMAKGLMTLSKEIMKSDPRFIKNLTAVMFNNLNLARQYVPRKVDLDLLYFHAVETMGDLDDILDRSPLAWRPFVGRGFQVHELACHHEAVLDPGPAAQIGSILQQRLSILNRQQIQRVSPPIRHQREVFTPIYA